MKIFPFILRTLLLWLICPVIAFSQINENNCSEAGRVYALLEKIHYHPLALDDSLAVKTFENFIKALDPSRLYFTRQDSIFLASKSLEIDDNIRNKNCSFLTTAIKQYQKALLRADSILVKMAGNPIDFVQKDSIVFIQSKKGQFRNDVQSLENKWAKWIKYQVIKEIFSPADESDDPFSISEEALLSREPFSREKICKIYQRNIEKKIDHPMGFENHVAMSFFNAITTAFDPHSNYYSLSMTELFLSHVSKNTYSFGIEIGENEEGEVLVEKLVPGSPAWKSNAIHKGDKLLVLKESDEKIYQLSQLDIYEVNKLLVSNAEKSIELTIEKSDGREKEIILQNENAVSEENIINSLIIDGDKKVGYIALPGFYTDMDNQRLGCANDVAKELIKLKNEGVEGLILDLRNNGGGALNEAIGLAGIFIDSGPVFIQKDSEGNLILKKDMNRGTIYNGPLVVMVNGLSASASEVFAGVMQDYNRAVIVGSPTYGKATAQILFPTNIEGESEYSDYNTSDLNSSFMKTTYSKIYRLDGRTYQKEGIQPDVYLPDLMEYFIEKEATYETALANDKIVKKVYYKPLKKLPVFTLQKRSLERQSENEYLKKVQKTGEFLKKTKLSEHVVPLDIQTYKNEKSQAPLVNGLEELEGKESSRFVLKNTAWDEELMQMDKYRELAQHEFKTALQKDTYLEETYLILRDLIDAK
ncbi:carboxy terminal-processing peptidase [Flexithrix dorotheae]|uniref:carboxy terminal-processing peptidase n=1 Tax=Flexithrix dorotheae TaxID=70993 RepID=UPI00038074A0|nr:carboxy terminal-processing peptidase [Flexithrix dorotheae]